MLPFATILLRDYHNAIGWNEDNTYTQLTRSSTALLDFATPSSLILQLSKAPTPVFFTSYALDALPQLNGTISYITTSEGLSEIGPSKDIPFPHVVERFRIFPSPKRPLPKEEVWQGGRRVEGRDYLLYSRLHLPSLHLSGLATTRLTPTLQAHLAFLSQPSPPTPRASSTSSSPTYSHSRQPSESAPPSQPPTPGNILLSLQHDTGRYSGEYTYSAQDGMFGVRGLYNFGWHEGGITEEQSEEGRRIDEEEMMEGGLRGRFSAGGEVYFSAKQRSFGISTGLRFTTVPSPSATTAGISTPNTSAESHGPPPSPPTTLTLLYNPLMGFISSAYSAQVSPTMALSSRFGFNIYSYESDLTIGGEWWIGRRRGKRDLNSQHSPAIHSERPWTGTSLRNEPIEENVMVENQLDSPFPIAALRENAVAENELDSPIPLFDPAPTTRFGTDHLEETTVPKVDNDLNSMDRDGVLKAKVSGNWAISLLYEARIRNCLVSVGVTSNLTERRRPIQSVGLEVQYFS